MAAECAKRAPRCVLPAPWRRIAPADQLYQARAKIELAILSCIFQHFRSSIGALAIAADPIFCPLLCEYLPYLSFLPYPCLPLVQAVALRARAQPARELACYTLIWGWNQFI